VILLVAQGLLLWSTEAAALPAPKTEAELLQLSDLVVDAECVMVICDGKPVTDPQKTITNYLSTLWPSKSYKGGLPNSFQVRGAEYAWVGVPPVGGWHQEPIKKGWIGKLYLAKLSDGTYTKVWWNANVEDSSKSNPQPLPSCALATDGGVNEAGPPPDGPVADGSSGDGPLPGKDQTAPPEQSVDTSPSWEPVADETWPTGDTALPPPAEDDGCSCRTVAARGDASTLSPLAALLLIGLLLRRRAPCA